MVKNGSKRRFSTSGGMPLPVSATSRTTTSVGLSASGSGVESGAQRDVAIVSDAVGRILDQVDEHLFDLLGIDPNPRIRAIQERNSNVQFAQLRSQERLHLAQRLVGVHQFELRFRGSCEREEVAHDPFEAANFPADEFGVLVLGGAGVQVFLLDEQPCFEGRQRIADLMRDPGGKHSQGSQFLLSFDQLLAFHEFDLQRSDHSAVNHHGQARAGNQQEEQRTEQQHPQMIQRFIGLVEEGVHGVAMRVGQLERQYQNMLRLFLEAGELAQTIGAEGLAAKPGMDLAGRVHVAIIRKVDLVENRLFLLARQNGTLVVNPAIQRPAVYIETRPLVGIAGDTVAKDRIVQLQDGLLEMMPRSESSSIARQ